MWNGFLMRWVCNLVYLLLLTALAPVILWRMFRHGRYRRGWKQKLFGQLPTLRDSRPVVWFHAVSVGEVLQLQKVVDDFHRQTANAYQLIVTTSTDTGFELASDRFPECTVSWFPLDFSWAVSAALRRVRPTLVVLMELELWPNFLLSCQHFGTKTALVNARMSDRSFAGYFRLRRLLKPIFTQFSAVGAQTEEYARRLSRLGIRSEVVHVTGSIKFDGVLTDRHNPATRQLRSLFDIVDDDVVFIAGSTQHPEEQLALASWQLLRREHPQLRLILVPRHRERFDESRSRRLLSRASGALPLIAAAGRHDIPGRSDSAGHHWRTLRMLGAG